MKNNYMFFRIVFWISLLLLTNKLFGQKNEVIVVKAPKPFTVVIDAGHGGKDPGNVGSKKLKKEKDLNLAIALKVGKYIDERITNAHVVYTRTNDATLSLDERVEIANINKADYFISIHCNSTPVRSVYGTQVHIQSHGFATSKALAIEIDKQFKTRASRKSRGILARSDRGYNYQVLQYTEMPGVLVESGFMTNPTEEKYLNSSYGQDIIASAVFRGFRDFVMRSKPPKPDDRSTFYKVQIGSSTKKENTKGGLYRKLGMRVDEIIDEKAKSYKYRYMVAREYEKKVAEKIARDVRKLGFKDAFVVEFKVKK